MLANSPEISIIIPAYNAQLYLAECLSSVVSQTFSDWELIIADDGSSDKKGEIADRYAEKDSRIKVIHSINRGVSASRNACIDIAQGRYLSFVDADDILEPDYLNELIGYAKKYDADITQCSFSFIYNEGEKKEDTYAKDSVFHSRDEIIKAYFNGPVGDIRVSVWAKLFKRGSFRDIRFDTGLRVYEDAYYVYECCRKAVTVCSFSSALYNYRQHEGSAMSLRLPEIYPDYFTVFEKQRNDYRDEGGIRKSIIRREVENAFWLIRIMLSEGKEQEIWNIRKAALKLAGPLYFSSLPILLKFKMTGIAVMPHIYFALLRKRIFADNEKV